MRAIIAAHAGGPDVLEIDELPDPRPGPGEVLVRTAAVGVNFIDVYRRSGIYPASFPQVPGTEGSGTVVEVGPDVDDVAVGDRVAWTDAPGSYAELVVVAADRAIPVPEGVPLDIAAAAAMQGLTAHYLATATYPVRGGDDVLVHAGAGGVGLLLTQIAAMRGARVITTVSSTEKAELSRAAGAEVTIDYTRFPDLTTGLSAKVRRLTGGDGVRAVFDGVGRTTFDASLASLGVRGVLVLFGGASGQVPPFDLQRLNSGGSLYVTRPTLGDYVRTRAELLARAGELYGWIEAGTLDVRVGQTFPLAEAGEAQRALAERRTTGKVLLVP